MNSERRDLWGEFDREPNGGGPDPVHELMQEQAALLAEKTDGRLEGRVEINSAPGAGLRVRFMIVVPALNGYRYELFYVVQRALEAFPIELWQAERVIECHDVAHFEAALAKVLQSKATQKALTQLRQLAREASNSNDGRV